jgi:hypothetical protein
VTSPTTVTSVTSPTSPTTPTAVIEEGSISHVVYYLKDSDGNITTVKLDYSGVDDIIDPLQPADQIDELETLVGDELGEVVGYTAKGATATTHVEVQEDGNLRPVNDDYMNEVVVDGQDENGVNDSTHVDVEGVYTGSQIKITGSSDYPDLVGESIAVDQSSLTFSSLFSSDSLFGESGGSGGGNGGGSGGGRGNQPDIDTIVDGSGDDT